MKNHVMNGSKLLQTNKKWSHLKQSQREWIFDITKEEVAAYIAAKGHLPGKKGRLEILDKIHGRILEREIWIPYEEMKMHVCKLIARVMRRHEAQNSKSAPNRVRDEPAEP